MSNDSPQQTASQAQKSQPRRLRIYAVGIALYLVMIGILILLLTRWRSEDLFWKQSPTVLSAERITAFLTTMPQVAKDDEAATGRLRDGLHFYRNRRQAPGNLYRSVRNLKLHLAYSARKDFEDAHHSAIFRMAMDELISSVVQSYSAAITLEREGDWATAHDVLGEILGILPNEETAKAENLQPLINNIREHLTYVRPRLDVD